MAKRLDVDHFLTIADGLDEEAKTFVKRGGGNHGASITPDQLAHALKMASTQAASRDDVSISNPAIFPTAWKGLLDILSWADRSRGPCAPYAPRRGSGHKDR